MITSTVFAEGGSNEGGNRENPFREIVLSRLNASVTPECLLFQNSILKLREKSSKIEMTFQNQEDPKNQWPDEPLFVQIKMLKSFTPLSRLS